jgi:glycosyltransferase involved in cell wall biosynthesis
VSEIKPDVISVCDDGVKGLLIPLWLKKNYKAIIYERHVSRLVQQDSERISLKERMLFKLMRFGAKKYDRFIVLTQGNIAEWHGLDNIEVIPNPLPFNPSVISTCENKRVITVGRFVYQKGYDYLVDVWKQINNLHPDWHLVIYGTGPDEELIKRLILQKEVKNISIHPPVKDIAAEYSASSIYVLTSRFEGFGMVLIEAMSCGLPCVSFDCPCGPSDIITDGTEGFLIPSYDIKTFVSKLSELMSDNHLRRGMGRQGRQNIDRYKPEQICNQWRLLFNQLITEEKKR